MKQTEDLSGPHPGIAIRPPGRQGPPWELLLAGDPSRGPIPEYIKSGLCYIGYLDDHLVGVFVLAEISPKVAELMNISIATEP